MIAAEVDVMIAFIFTGTNGEVIPVDATHVSIDESITVIPEYLFYDHPLVELISHLGVERIEEQAFWYCPGLKRLIIPGVKEVEVAAFNMCESVTYVECDNLERIGEAAFGNCVSISNIDLPSIRVIENDALRDCEVLTEAKFGKKLESIGFRACYGCRSLERITIPLKNGLFDSDDIFQGCTNLRHIDLADRVALNQTINALLLEEWRNEINEEIDIINHILPDVAPGDTNRYEGHDPGGKTVAIREWITRVLGKIAQHKSAHHSILNEAAATLSHALPNDIVINNIIPFLELPPHEFDRGNHE